MKYMKISAWIELIISAFKVQYFHKIKVKLAKEDDNNNNNKH